MCERTLSPRVLAAFERALRLGQPGYRIVVDFTHGEVTLRVGDGGAHQHFGRSREDGTFDMAATMEDVAKAIEAIPDSDHGTCDGSEEIPDLGPVPDPDTGAERKVWAGIEQALSIRAGAGPAMAGSEEECPFHPNHPHCFHADVEAEIRLDGAGRQIGQLRCCWCPLTRPVAVDDGWADWGRELPTHGPHRPTAVPEPAAIFPTIAGIKVFTRGFPRGRDGLRGGDRWGVACWRVDTGGFHGNLRLEKLQPVNGHAARMQANPEGFRW